MYSDGATHILTGILSLFHDRLSDGGYLLLGHSESLLDLSDRFEFASLTHDVAYRREGA